MEGGLQLKLKRRKSVLSIIVILSFFFLFFTSPVFANELTIQRKGLEFEVIPQDQELINISNMSPGDEVTSKLTIMNNFENEVEVYFRAERLDKAPGEGEPDLYKQIQMTVKLDGDVVDYGPMSNIATGSGILLGVFQAEESQEMEVTATLPGQGTGNEFMGLSHKNKFIFTVSGEEIVIIDDEDIPLGGAIFPPRVIEDEEVPLGPAKLPKTGASSMSLFYILGAGMILVGGAIIKKED